MALFLAAAIWRLSYVARLAASPLGGSLRDDAQIYWDWASRLLQAGPMGTHPFFLGPLYPYVLAGLRGLGIASVGGILVVQALWGAAAVVLLADATRRLAGTAIGTLVGLLAAGYQGAVFFDGLILAESLLFALESLLVWWVVRREGSAAGGRTWAVAGLLIGLCAAGRATSSLLLLAALPLLRGAGPWFSRPTLARAGALAGGFLVVALPIAARNRAVAGEWIGLTYNAGLNLYVGNHPGASGSYAAVTDEGSDRSSRAPGDGGGELDGRDHLRRVEGVALTPAQSSRHWTAKAWRHARDHPLPTLGLAVRKLGMMWNRREYPQIEHREQYRSVAGPLGWPLVGTFALLGPLALAGGWFAGRSSGGARFVVLYAVVTTLAVAPFFVTDRYRHHLVPAAAILAGVALQRARAALSGREPGAGRVAAAILGGLIVAFLPAPAMDATRTGLLLRSDLGARWLERGRPDRAAREFEAALATLAGSGARPADKGLGADEEADLLANYGRALLGLGRGAESAAWLERALRLAPGRASLLESLAEAYASAGQAARADSIHRRLEQGEDSRAPALVRRGWGAARAGDLAAAERLFLEAAIERPDLAGAWGGLIRVQTQAGRLIEARATLARARNAGLPEIPLRVYQALLFALDGDAAAAERALAEVPARALAEDPSLADVARVAREVLARAR